jgi:hypothetical protein
MAHSVFTTSWSGLRNRRGKRAPSLPKLIRKVGPRAPALLERVTKQGIARMDALAARAPLARSAAAGCPPQSESFTSSGGDGTTAQVTATTNGIGVDLTGPEFRVELDLNFGCEPQELQAPRCPTAVGRLQGEIRYKLRAGVKVSRGGELLWSQAMDVTRRTELDGFNDVDAKLDRLDIEDVETSNFHLGGSIRGYPPIAIRTRIVRRTQVDMRSGDYDPGRSDISVTVDTAGLGGPDRADVEDDIAERGRAEADRQFRAIVDKAISGYRSRETDWLEPTCAELRFSPRPNTRTLRPNQSGSFTATAISKRDGGPSELDARLSNTVNARFDPARAGGQQARFGYAVVSAPSGAKVQVSVRATSKAGVAKGTWEQPLPPPFQIEKIAGNFSGTEDFPVGSRTAHVSWTGAATFQATPAGLPGAVGSYVLKAGQVTYTFSGADILGDAACDMSGTEFVDLFQKGGGDLGVVPVGSSPFEQGPHTYSGGIFAGPTALVTVTLSNCADPSVNGETRTFPVVQGGFAPLDIPTPVSSTDGIHYNGTRSLDVSGVSVHWTWVFTGAR